MLTRLLRSLRSTPAEQSPTVKVMNEQKKHRTEAVPEKSALNLPSLPFMIRPLEPADQSSLLHKVFVRAIQQTAKRDYSEEQLNAWANNRNQEEFAKLLHSGVTVIAENHGNPIAFAQLHPITTVHMLYVDPEWSGLGIATLLCQYLEDEARIIGANHLTTLASHTAKRFFESMGYRAQKTETVTLNSVSLEHIYMEKKLGRL